MATARRQPESSTYTPPPLSYACVAGVSGCVSEWVREESRIAVETEATRQALLGDLRALGVHQPERLLTQHEWTKVALVLADVREWRADPDFGHVRNWPGLLVTELRRPGCRAVP